MNEDQGSAVGLFGSVWKLRFQQLFIFKSLKPDEGSRFEIPDEYNIQPHPSAVFHLNTTPTNTQQGAV